MSPSLTSAKSKDRADNLVNAYAVITEERSWEPEGSVTEQDHQEWVEIMTLRLTNLRLAGAPEGEVDQLANDIFATHLEQLVSLFGQWPTWASPIMTVQWAQEEEDCRQAQITEICARQHIQASIKNPMTTTSRVTPPPPMTPITVLSSVMQDSGLLLKTHKCCSSVTQPNDSQPAKKPRQCEHCLRMGLPSCTVLSQSKCWAKCFKDVKKCAKYGEPYGQWFC
ncbi:hypothetical protein V8D89_007183 [Ganoderma adspersum]